MPRSLNPLKAFSRWRHGRGFGIHSPFAFRFVTEVLRQPYAYYAYRPLGSDPELCLLVRLIAALRPQSIEIIASPERQAALERAAALAAPHTFTQPDGHNGTLLAVDCRGLSPEILDSVTARLERNDGRPHAVFFDLRRPVSISQFGMTFSNNSRTTVVVSHPHLPCQHFDVRF